MKRVPSEPPLSRARPLLPSSSSNRFPLGKRPAYRPASRPLGDRDPDSCAAGSLERVTGNSKQGRAPLLACVLALWPILASSPVEGGTPSETEEKIARRFPAVVPMLRTNTTFQPVTAPVGGTTGLAPDLSGALPPPGLRVEELTAWREMTRSWRSFFPASLEEPFVVEGEGVRVAVRALGVARATADPSSGKIVYTGAYPETDILYTASPGRTEELLLLNSPEAPVRFDYEILGVEGASEVSLRDGSVFLTDARGHGLVIVAPVVLDAEGRRNSTHVRWELESPRADGVRHLTLRLDPSGLAYPLLVDPTWTTTGNLNTARGVAGAVLLQTGQVLVMTGYPNTQVTAELYDPATGLWTLTGSLPAGHLGRVAPAVLLGNGQVLLAGGAGPGVAPVADCLLYDPATGTWTATGSLILARMMHTLTLLGNGRVLAAGGENALNAPMNTAELYDPATGTWTRTPLMPGAQAKHSATLLRDGRVLLAGGLTGGSTVTGLAQIYDPAAGTWALTNSMLQIREEHSATLLPSGDVLVAGGFVGSDLSEAELYHVALGTWTTTGSMLLPRAEGVASLLPNGTVLVAGGCCSPGVIAEAETYTPGTGLWSVTASLNGARFDAASVVLPNGKALVIGGSNGTTLATAELYDRDSGSWTPTPGHFSNSRADHTTTLIPGGKVLAAGGVGSDPTFTGAEVYDPTSGTWSTTGSLITGRYRHVATLLGNGTILAAGGINGGPNPKTTETFDPSTGTWSAAGTMSVGREYPTATLLPCGEVLIVGGSASAGVVNKTAERYNPVTRQWRPTGSLNIGRWRHTATLLLDGTVLVAGGFTAAGATATSEIYDPVTEVWTPTAGSMSVPRYFHTATLLPSGKVLVAGQQFPPGAGATAELYDPAKQTWTITGAMLDAISNHAATLLPNGKVLVSGGRDNNGPVQPTELYDPATLAWSAAGLMTSPRELHTSTLLLDGTILVAGGADGPDLFTSEVYNVGRGELAAWRPNLTTATSPLVQGSALAASGSGFQGISEASWAGNTYGTATYATNYPLVQLRRLDNEALSWLPLDPAAGWSDTSFKSTPLTSVVPGPSLITVFTNGIPSPSQGIFVQGPVATITGPPSPVTICQGLTATFTVGVNASCPAYQWRKNGVPLVDGGHDSGSATSILTVSSADSTDVGNYDVVVSEACNPSTTTSAAASLTVTSTLSGVSISDPGPTTICTTCTGGTSTVTDTGGGADAHQWGFRTVSGGVVTPIAGQTGASYLLNGADFPGAGSYFVVETTTPACGSAVVSNEIPVTIYVSVPGNAVQFFTVTSVSGQNTLEWLNPAIGASYVSTQILVKSVPGTSACTFPTSPSDLTATLITNQAGGGAGAKDSFVHGGLANDGTTYCYAAFVQEPGPVFSAGRFTKGRPFDTTGPVKWAYSTGATAMAPPGIGAGVFVGSNDRVLHSMMRGTLGGLWPAPWTPLLLNGPDQGRPAVVTTSLVPGASQVVFLGAQDGFAYAVNAQTGVKLWQSPLQLGDILQASPAGMFKASGGAFDYLLVGTRSTTVANAFYALKVADGTVVGPPFTNGGGVNAFGVVNGKAAVDYPNNRVYFTSRQQLGGSLNTVWALNITAGGLNLAWGLPLGDIDGPPALKGSRLYVGTNAGVVAAVDTPTPIAAAWTFSAVDGAVKGGVFADRLSSNLYFSTGTKVWGLSDAGVTFLPLWPAVTVPGPSPVLFDTGTALIFVGGSDGKLYQLDATLANSTTPPVVKTVVLGDGLAAVGSPTLDVPNNVILVGTEAGVVYAVQIPIP